MSMKNAHRVCIFPCIGSYGRATSTFSTVYMRLLDKTALSLCFGLGLHWFQGLLRCDLPGDCMVPWCFLLSKAIHWPQLTLEKSL